ncbi:MAG: SMI1/KNR4 family protein, partial [Defluviitaleaceae bacterium]|nr:SMI1/KNR4 family protein [Defluviitaleaceae bacterium]
EIAQLEAEKGITLPPSYKAAVMEIGKTFKYSYDFSNYNVPESEDGEYQFPYKATFSWNLSDICVYEPYTSEELEGWKMKKESAIRYVALIKNRQLYLFATVPDGDYCFDISSNTEDKPVVDYGDVGNDYSYLAHSFAEYLEKTLELKGWGNDDPFGYDKLWFIAEAAGEYLEWFNDFVTTELKDVSNDLDKILKFASNRLDLDEKTEAVLQKWVDIIKKETSLQSRINKLDKLFDFTMKRESLEQPIENALNLYEKPILLEKLKAVLRDEIIDIHNAHSYFYNSHQKACAIITKCIGAYAKDWLLSFWENATKRGKNNEYWTYDGITLEVYQLKTLIKHCT